MKLRFVLLMPAALLVTLALFYLMALILHRHNDFGSPTSTPVRAEFLMPQREIESIQKIKKPDRPISREEPPLQQASIKLANSELSGAKFDFEVPTIEANIKIAMSMSEGPNDSDYVPILKVAPIYPQRAANRSLEGYVIVQYSISASGGVHSVTVIEAKPAGVFNQAAIEAARKFKYKPRKIGGKATAVHGVKNRFTFTLEKQ